MTDKVIIIAGPTASGKSNLAIELSKKLPIEIISCDSMQIYRGMDIGTAKVSKEEQAIVKHHLIDIVDPKDNFSVQEFQVLAKEKIQDILSRAKIPVLVGGTGLYINSIIYNYDFNKLSPNKDFRDKLEEAYEKNPALLLERVHKIDANQYGNLTIKDKKKIIRALEVFEFTGKTVTNEKEINKDYKYLLYVIYDHREILYDKINKRVDLMIDQGLIEEVNGLLSCGLGPEDQSMKAIGYREVIPYLKNEITYDQMLEKLKQDSRRYAKRQLTWFRSIDFARWLNKYELTKEQMIDLIIEEINEI